MAYFAQLENDLVIQVRVVEQSFMAQNPDRYPGVWVETFLDGDDLKLMASPGYTYDSETGHFIPPKPFESWVLNEDTCLWDAPVPMPEETDADGNPVPYVWDEDAGDWIAADVE